jgi:PEGA domain
MFNPRAHRTWLLLSALLFLAAAPARSQETAATSGNKIMGEVVLQGAKKIDRDSGVWIDGNYVGYAKELHGSKKILLLPGEHEVIVRQSGYDDFVRKVTVEPGQVQTVAFSLQLSPKATLPEITSMLKLYIEPKRAAVFLDGKFVGHAGEFGGAVHSMLVAPGKHNIRVELPGYRTFETTVDLLPNQKSEVKTKLVPGSIEQAGPDIKQKP